MDNLLDEGVLPATVFCTGKTGIDSLKAVLDDADARVRDAIGKRNRVLVTLPSESARRAAHPAPARFPSGRLAAIRRSTSWRRWRIAISSAPPRARLATVAQRVADAQFFTAVASVR